MRNIHKHKKNMRSILCSLTYLTCAFPRILLDSGAGRAFGQNFKMDPKSAVDLFDLLGVSRRFGLQEVH